MEPKVVLRIDRIRAMLRSVLDARFGRPTDFTPTAVRRLAYPTEGHEMSVFLRAAADELRSRAIHELGLERYKFVAVVSVGTTPGTSTVQASRCLLDARRDGFVTESIADSRMYAVATLYAMYVE